MQQRQLWRKEAVGQNKSSKTRGTVTSSSNARPRFGLTTKAENRWTPRSTSLRSSSVVVNKSRPASGPHSSRPAQCTPRAQSSLGFSRGTTTTSGAYEGSKPIGFDIAQYIQLRGSAANVRIGINGDPSATDYFRSYVRECQVRVKQDEDLDWDLESESDTETEEETVSSAQEHSVHMRKTVPLCWEDQVQKTEPSSLKTPRELERVQIERTLHSTKENDCTPPKLALSSVQFSEKLKHMSKYSSVMLSSRDCCITSWRDLQQLREASSRMHNVHVPSSQCVPLESDDSLDHFLAEDDSEDEQMDSDLPTEANHKQLTTELLPKLSHTSPEAGSSLCIWLEVPQGLWPQEELSRLEFDVFVTAASPGQVQPSTKAFTKRKAKRISDTIYVLLLDLPWRPVPPPPPSSHAWAHSVQSTGAGSHKIRVAVVCCNPRVMFFCMEAKTELGTLCSNNPAMGGSGDTPQKFFRKRSSYCNQEEDEDMTDMRAIAKQFPDLRVLDFEGSSLEGTPFSSPVRQSLQSTEAHRALTKLVDSERPLHHPGVRFLPSSASTGSSYVDVVRQWLKPYLDH